MIETYTIINNIDDSIFCLNDYVKKHGYEFVKIEISKLESDFSGLFKLPKHFHPTLSVRTKHNIVSKEFHDLFSESQLNTKYTFDSGNVIFLKRIEKFKQEAKDNILLPEPGYSILFRTKEFSDLLVRKLRLFKAGGIQFQKVFHKDETSNQLLGGLGQFDVLSHRKVYNIETIEINDLIV